MRSIVFGSKARVVLHEGKLREGPLAGLDTLDVRIDDTVARLKLTEAIEARLEPSRHGGAVHYTLVVTHEGKEVSRLNGRLGSGAVPMSQPSSLVARIKPPALSQDQLVKMLPATVGDLCAAAGGRLFILHLPKIRKLAVFDVSAAQMVKYLPVAEDSVRFAAGMDKLIVALPSSNVLQRWSLVTFEREATVPCPVPVGALAMGCASHGPLVVGVAAGPGRGSGLRLLEPVTFKEGDYRLANGGTFGFDGQGARLRVSADGRVITGSAALVQEGKMCKSYPVPAGALPGPDGRDLYTPGQLYTAQGKPLGQKAGGQGRAVWYVPGLHGPYYLSVNELRESGPSQSFLSLRVHILGDGRPLATFPRLDALERLMNGMVGSTDPADRHIFLIPDAQLLVIIPVTQDRLVLQRFDLDQLLAKAGVDYLFVASQPPPYFQPGGLYSYQLAVKSKQGGVKYKLESGPQGMKLSADGNLTWDVPAGLTEAEVDVIITVSDASGQEVFHTFKIAVRDRQMTN